MGIAGVLNGQSIPVPPQGITLGRSRSADTVIDDEHVSKKHVWVGIAGVKLIVRDLNALNGTFLNDDLEKPIKEAELKQGDTLALGKHGLCRLRVEID